MLKFSSSGRVLLYSILLSCIYEIHGSNETMEVTFHFYSREKTDTVIDVSTPIDVLQRLFTKKERIIVVIIHGWLQSYKAPEMQKMLKAYLESTEYYVIMCNWKYLAEMEYFSSAEDTHEAGKRTGDLLLTLQSMDLCSVSDNVHVVGHSLGAHVAGYCGAYVKNRTSGKSMIRRITGLDPAGPGYSFIKVAHGLHTLSKYDALFVVVIHTCGELLGIYKPIGCIDFYCNGGTHPQPFCNFADIPCSHRMSCEYFAFSIRLGYGFFIAKRCDSKKKFEDGDCNSSRTALMGEYTDEESECGKYYLKTTDHEPYSL